MTYSKNERNINLVCLFKGIKTPVNNIEPGSYVDAMLSEPYSLATAFIKAYAERNTFIKNNYNINIINLTDNGEGIIDQVRYQSDFISRILSNNPVAVGFSTYCWNIDATLTIIKKIKQINPDIKTIIGGRYALKDYLLIHPEIDYIIRGEGEIAFTELLRNGLSSKAKIKGVSYRTSKNNIIDGGEGDIITELDSIPSPFTSGIIKPNSFNMMLELSRGCLNKCGYCDWNSNKSLRFHSEKRIREEILYALKNGIKHITIIDSAINYSTDLLKHISGVVRILKPEHLIFSYNLRYEHIDNNQIRYLKNIPSFQVLLGLESINQEALTRSNRKAINLLQFSTSIKLLNSYCRPLVGVILGLPYDTPESFKKTILYLKKLNQNNNTKLGGVLVSLLQVFPDSFLYKNRDLYKIKIYSKGVPYIKSNITWKNEMLRDISVWLKSLRKLNTLNIKGIEGEWRLINRYESQ